MDIQRTDFRPFSVSEDQPSTSPADGPLTLIRPGLIPDWAAALAARLDAAEDELRALRAGKVAAPEEDDTDA
jgi:hypothetical protein